MYLQASAAATILKIAAAAAAASLTDLCTVANVQAALPVNGTLLGIEMIPSASTATLTNSSSAAGGMSMLKRQSASSDPTSGNSTSSNSTGGSSTASGASSTYCNVKLAYTHTGKGDTVSLVYALPDPTDFQNRFYVAGGGGYALSSTAAGGLSYGAAGGATDAGYSNFSMSNGFDENILYGNGSINWDATYMFGYQALGEMTQIGKTFIRSFYGISNASRIYTYFEGCSDGGRQGMSQIQRWGSEYDGVITGAPTFRFAQQQVLHVFPAVVEQALDYYPPPCALAKIVNATIAACDRLDGRIDGVVSRSDLCKLNFDLAALVGESYYCAGSASTSLGFGYSNRFRRQTGGAGGAEGSQTSYNPTQNGTVTAQDVAVAQSIYNGLFDSNGQRAYLSWQIASALSDGDPTYDNTTGKWQLNIPSTGGAYVAKFIELWDVSNLADLDGVTYDTLVDWMKTGYYRYLDSLQTTIPDLTAFQSSGGKLLHYHGESDPSVPAASSVHYWQSVRAVMYGNAGDDEALDALSDWYQLYLVPGAAHCGTNDLQPGPYPQHNMDIMIDWVENGVKPSALNATVSSGPYEGETQMLCQWPTRPLWSGNGSSFDCVTDAASLDSWTYSFPAFKVDIY